MGACEAIELASTAEYDLADAITHLQDRGHRIEMIELEGERDNDYDAFERTEGLIGSESGITRPEFPV